MKISNLKVTLGAFALTSLILAGCNLEKHNENSSKTVGQNTVEINTIDNQIKEEEKLKKLEEKVTELDEKIDDLEDERTEILEEIETIRNEQKLSEEVHPCVLKNELLKNYDEVTDEINLNDGFIKSEEEFNYVLDRITKNRKKVETEYLNERVNLNILEFENYSADTKQKLNKFLIDLGKMYEFSAIGISLEDISFLQKTNIRNIDLTNNKITNIDAISTIKDLHYLTLDNNQISNLSPLAKHNKLQDLSLNNNDISDLTALSNLTNLELLSLDYNNITDLTPLSLLINLVKLEIEYNNITNLDGLQNMYMLEELYLRGNDIKDITSIIPIIEKNDVFITFESLDEENISKIIDVYNNDDRIYVKAKK